jgi:hypothetical protein
MNTIFEFRAYRMRPGLRDAFAALFEREFVQTQEAVGITVLGRYVTPDDPDLYVWMRAYPDMETRKRVLHAFYDGPVWARHRDEANATMINSDNVLLLKNAWTDSTKDLEQAWSRRVPLVATVSHLASGTAPAFGALVREPLEQAAALSGAAIAGAFVSAAEPNNFPRHPVRPDEVFLRLVACDGEAAFHHLQAGLQGSERGAAIDASLWQRDLHIRLEPVDP